MPVIKHEAILETLEWGYQTSFAFIINARSEEMTEKNIFKPILSKRCVIVVEGYYEWNPKKEPFMFWYKNGKLMFIAAHYKDE